MSLTAPFVRLFPSSEQSGNFIRDAWDRLSGVPGGNRLFSRFIGRVAPYTSTIGARVDALHAGYARVTMRDRRSVRNHLHSVHAIALLNLAELTGNLALAYGLPDDARFIVAGISIEYLKKARGTIVGISDFAAPAGNERREYEIPVSLRDEAGEEVARASLRSLVGPKRT